MTSTTETLPPSADGALIETAAFEATAPSRRMPRLRAIFGAFIVGLVVALVASGAGLYAYDRVHDGQIVHGVRIAGIDVSDLGRDAAAERLRAGLASFGQGTVVVSDGVVKESLTYAALGRGPAIDTLLDQAFAIGRTGTIVDRGLDEVRTATRGVGIAPAVTVDAAAVATAVAALGNREDRAPVDASAITTASGFATVAARPGRSVDRNAMTAAIVAALSKVDAPAQIDLALITTPVAPTVDDAAATAARNTAALMARDLTVVGSKDSRKIAGSTIRALDLVRDGRRHVRPAHRADGHRSRPEAARQGRRPEGQGRHVPRQQERQDHRRDRIGRRAFASTSMRPPRPSWPPCRPAEPGPATSTASSRRS